MTSENISNRTYKVTIECVGNRYEDESLHDSTVSFISKSLAQSVASAIMATRSPRICQVAADIVVTFVENEKIDACSGVVTDEMADAFANAANEISEAWGNHDSKFNIPR